MERQYYTINENTAKVANDINSFSNYATNSATNGYNSVVDEVYNIVEQIAQVKPRNYEKAKYMADRFSKKYADYLNDYYRNEASCPSVMICGAGNFPVKKKNKQNARRDALMDKYNGLQHYKSRIEKLLYFDAPIQSNDADAIERIQDKITDLEAEKETMKLVNSYYKKYGSLEGIDIVVPDKMIDRLNFLKSYGLQVRLDTTNVNSEIRRLKDRLANLQEVKDNGSTEEEHDGFRVVENTELMRLQILFDDKPDEATRTILKSNGFKWSPSNQAWQRQLTANAKFALKTIIDKL